MDVTPQAINEVEFHQKMRGYDPDEVDDFLERVAVAVEQFQERIRAAEHRALEAERRANDIERRGGEGIPAQAPAAAAAAAAPTNEVDETETIRRTLVLAQRTADAAIKEARDEADSVLSSAQEQVQRLHTEAQDQARKLVIDAESDARKKSDDTRQRLVREIISLEETRDSLRADQGILERHLDEQRLRLRSSIGELQRLLDDPGRLRVAAAPEISGATMPELIDPPVITDDDVQPTVTESDDDDDVEFAPPAAASVDAEVQDDDGDVDDVIDLEPARAPYDVEEERAITGSVTFTPAAEDTNGSTEPSGLALGRIAVAGASPDEDAWIRFANGELDGPPTMEVAGLDSGEDAYLTELRKAMLDDTSAAHLDPDEHRARTRFGRRR